MSAPVRWHPFANADELAQQACAWIVDAAGRALAERAAFSIVLAGGSTPRAAYELLRGASADWSRWHVYFGDERCLPADDAQRNSHMARAAWLDHVALPPRQVHVIAAERGADAAARAYAQDLRGVAEFDLVLLGLGEDGHTASLFPGHDLGLGANAPDVLAVHDAPKAPPQRVTLSAARLSRARCVLFLVTGSPKQSAVDAWRSGRDIPAAAIQPPAGVDVLLERSLMSGPHPG